MTTSASSSSNFRIGYFHKSRSFQIVIKRNDGLPAVVKVVRNENELNRIREYIMNNPLRWELDRENLNGQRDIGQVQGQAQEPAPTKYEPWRA